MESALQEFYEQPTGERYRRIRAMLLHECSSPTAEQLDCFQQLVTEGNVDESYRVAASMLPQWSLSPRFHYFSALLAEQAGDSSEAELEQFLFQVCLQGVLDTGDGTSERPYLTTYRSDVEDILMALSLESDRKQLMHANGRMLVLADSTCGSVLHFDVQDCCDIATSPATPITAATNN